MAYSAIEISNYLVSQTNPDEGGELLSNMKLQKLLYYCQGLYYAKFKKPLFKDDIFAWQYGPVVPSVYHNFKQYGASGIPTDGKEVILQLDDKEYKFLIDVFSFFNQYSAIKLMHMTHSEAPWCSTNILEKITLDKLEKHFKSFLKVENE